MYTKLFISAAAFVLMGTTLMVAPQAYAQTPTNPITTLIERIAQKFGLKQSDVESVFNQFHTERQEKMQARMEDRLTQLVKNGTITEAQKQLILAKHKELQTKRESEIAVWQNMTPEERRAEKEKRHQALKDWATQNTIDLQYFGGPMGMGHGMKGMWR